MNNVLGNQLEIWWFYAKLNDKWRACQRLPSSRQGWLLYWVASMAGSWHFLTQFMSFQELQFFPAISWILILKNAYLVFLTMLLKILQSSTCFETLCYDMVKGEAVIFFIYSSESYIGFYFGFTFLLLYWWWQWRGTWHCGHMTCHMMWCNKSLE